MARNINWRVGAVRRARAVTSQTALGTLGEGLRPQTPPAWTLAEEVIRKRLAVEGEGGGDNRRVISLLKTFARWCS